MSTKNKSMALDAISKYLDAVSHYIDAQENSSMTLHNLCYAVFHMTLAMNISHKGIKTLEELNEIRDAEDAEQLKALYHEYKALAYAEIEPFFHVLDEALERPVRKRRKKPVAKLTQESIDSALDTIRAMVGGAA